MNKRTTAEVAARFHDLAQQNKWFEIQDELFAEDVQSIEPPGAVHLPNAQGKAAVRKKGESWVARVEAFHGGETSAPLVGGNAFAVARKAKMKVRDIGGVDVDQLMLYEVKDGMIVKEQFFYPV